MILKVFDILDRVEATRSHLEKAAIIRELDEEGMFTLQNVVWYTYNPFWLYRLTAPTNLPVDLEKWTAEDGSGWGHLKALLSSLNLRLIEVSTGKANLGTILARSDKQTLKWFTRIVNRDLKCGIASWNKFFPGLFPSEPMMLCDTWEGEELVGDWIAEPKIDGFRAVVNVDSKGNCDVISRGMKTFWNWEHVAQEIKSLGIRDIVLDGEFYAGNFGLTGSICKTQTEHPRRLELKYYVFDALHMDEWNSLKCERILRERKVEIEQNFYGLETKYLIAVIGERVNGHLSEIADRYYLQGYEGTVVKNLDTPYIFDRSTSWLKIKPECDCDVEITGMEEGSNKNTGRLGAFWVKGTVTYKKQKYDIVSKVGGGFSDAQREEFWKQWPEGKLMGSTIEVTYQDVTTEVCMGQTVPALRFPRFKRLRWDKSPVVT
jgi:DNA ligase 1